MIAYIVEVYIYLTNGGHSMRKWKQMRETRNARRVLIRITVLMYYRRYIYIYVYIYYMYLYVSMH